MPDQRPELVVRASAGFVPTPIAKRPARRGAARVVPPGGDVVPGLLEQGFDLVGTPYRIAPAPSGRRRAAAPKEVTAVARVGTDEDAVLLVEQDGVWTWHAPATRERVRSARGTRGAAPRTVGREITFVLGTDADAAQRRGGTTRAGVRGTGPSRGLVGKVVAAGARLFVLKFLAPRITDKVMEHLESGVTPRLVRLTKADPDSWVPVEPNLRVDGPRVLLFIHGTFSSTKGGFGHLASHPRGIALLNSALSHYDVVLGYDHRTLSVDPQQNAMELLGMLRALGWSAEPIFDIITHSRGALVTRSFVERVLPESDFRGRVDRIVFAAGVNAGTELANPKNWNTLLNLYTTLASAGARLIPDALASTITAEAIKGLGGLAKALISYAVEDDGIPGLAAMRPGGPFVTTLNEHQAHQPDPGTTLWYVLGADFEPHRDVGLPKAVLDWVVDVGVDQLMRQANDLVVNTSSMGSIDVQVGAPSGFVHDSHYYPSSAGVFHTIYFNQAETADLIREWLALAELTRVAVEARTRSAAGRGTVGRRGPGVVVHRSSLGMRRASDASLSALERRTVDGSLPSGSAIVLPRAGRGSVDLEIPAEVLDRLGVELPTRGESGRAAVRSPGRRSARRGTAAIVPPEPTPVSSRLENADVPLNVRASMPDHLAVGTVGTLRCTVAREKLMRLAGAGDVVQIGVDQARKLTVQVIAKAEVDIVGADRADIDVPAPDQPVDLFFDVRAVSVGEAEVHVIVRQGPVPLATLVVRPTVTTAARRRKNPGVALVVADDVSPEAPDTCVKQWLRIVEQKQGDSTRFLFDLQVDDPRRPLLVTAMSEPLMGSKEDYVAQVYAEIESRWLSNKDDAAAFGLDLKAIGGEMFDQLIPAELGEVLWANRTRLRNLLVFSDEPYIPWELVHLKHDGELPRQNWTLGRLGLLRWRGGADFPPDGIRHANVRAVVPQYPEDSGLTPLPELAAELAFLKKELGAKPIKADHASVVKAMQKPGSIDVLHFSGHGDGESATPAILLEGRMEDGEYVEDRLTDTTVGQVAHLAGKLSAEQRHEGVQAQRTMVVLNSCQTGRLTPGLTHVGGFADAFLRAGAGVFISSLWSIFDAPAELFTETLYRSLLDGMTLAEATVAARDACGHDAGGDATWLAYVVYGNPCAKFVG